jgi:hypothetical protein
MKRKLLVGLAVLGAIALKAQTVTPVLLSNQGGYSSFGTVGSISWSIGEPVSETYSVTSNVTTMGFHQPELNIVSMIRQQGQDVNVLVYPNPVKEVLTINFSGMTAGTYRIEMIDNIGKLISTSEVNITEQNQMVPYKINEVAAGNYFLRIDGKEFTKTVKINKIN